MLILIVQLELNIVVSLYDESPRSFLPSTAWYKCSQEQKNEYVNDLNELLLRVNIQHEAITCDNVDCKVHGKSIRDIYTMM